MKTSRKLNGYVIADTILDRPFAAAGITALIATMAYGVSFTLSIGSWAFPLGVLLMAFSAYFMKGDLNKLKNILGYSHLVNMYSRFWVLSFIMMQTLLCAISISFIALAFVSTMFSLLAQTDQVLALYYTAATLFLSWICIIVARFDPAALFAAVSKVRGTIRARANEARNCD